MLSKKQIQYFKSLHRKKYRDIEKIILLEGSRLINQVIIKNINILNVWITEKFSQTSANKYLLEKLSDKKINIHKCSEESLVQISDSLHPQGIIATVSYPIYERVNQIPQKSVYLDNISDPGNMGTLLRTCAWFGIESVFLSSNCVDPFNSKVIRSAMGAHFYFKNLIKIEYEKLFKKYKKNNIVVLCGDLQGIPIKDLPNLQSQGWVLVLGSEAHGITNTLEDYIDYRISIQNFSSMESLNVSIAGGILLHNLT